MVDSDGELNHPNNEKERNIIGPQFIDVKSTRVILVGSMNISAEYLKLFLRNIYGKLDFLRVKLNNYLLIPEKQNYLRIQLSRG